MVSVPRFMSDRENNQDSKWDQSPGSWQIGKMGQDSKWYQSPGSCQIGKIARIQNGISPLVHVRFENSQGFKMVSVPRFMSDLENSQDSKWYQFPGSCQIWKIARIQNGISPQVYVRSGK